MIDLIEFVQNWYAEQCNGEWEEDRGVLIDTLDNPGWMVKIDIRGTNLAGVVFPKVDVERTEADWFSCEIKDEVFVAYGGPRNLTEILSAFQGWCLQAGRDPVV